jgi:hypothetical protein
LRQSLRTAAQRPSAHRLNLSTHFGLAADYNAAFVISAGTGEPVGGTVASASQVQSNSPAAGSAWSEILPVIAVLGTFSVYATWRAFEGAYYQWGPYLSPFYSPLIDAHHHWWKLSPALLILGGPLGFRATCYYYRKAYYRAFFFDPPGCAIAEKPGRKYFGETKFPFILQNLHRYFLYVAIVFIAFLFRHRVWGGNRLDCVTGECDLAYALLVLLPFAASSCGRKARLLFVRDVWA